jgi:nitrate reductase alpha subunit
MSLTQAAHEFFRKGEANAEGWSMLIARGRGWEKAYRDRWRHDKVVRSTHGVNCTGSCSWNVYVKDGLITWESQAVDYPRTDPDRPDHEPRGCPRGASFSWYTYSPVRLKYPYVRGSLLDAWRAALASEPGGTTRTGYGAPSVSASETLPSSARWIAP